MGWLTSTDHGLDKSKMNPFQTTWNDLWWLDEYLLWCFMLYEFRLESNIDHSFYFDHSFKTLISHLLLILFHLLILLNDLVLSLSFNCCMYFVDVWIDIVCMCHIWWLIFTLYHFDCLLSLYLVISGDLKSFDHHWEETHFTLQTIYFILILTTPIWTVVDAKCYVMLCFSVDSLWINCYLTTCDMTCLVYWTVCSMVWYDVYYVYGMCMSSVLTCWCSIFGNEENEKMKD